MKHFRPQIYPLYIHWDLNACSPPKGKKAHLICRTIWSAARSRRLLGEPHIQIYYTKNTLDESILDGFYDARCSVICAADEFKKANAMLEDMHWQVITKIQQDTEYLIRGILSLEERGGREAFYLILPDTSVPTTGIMNFRNRVYLKLINSASDTCEIKAWGCNLLERILDEDEDLDDQMSHLKIAKEEQDDKSMEVAVEGPLWRPTFFYTSAINPSERNTSVLWDVEDYPLPARLSLYEFYENIKYYMKGEAASNGEVIIWAYVPDYMMEAYKTLADEFRSYEFEGVAADRFIFVPKVQGDKYARLHQMTLDLLLWAIDNLGGTQKGFIPNLLVISKNIQAETSFLRVLRGLVSRGCKVFLTLPPADDVAPKDVTRVTVLPWEDLLHRSWPTGMPSKRRKSLG